MRTFIRALPAVLLIGVTVAGAQNVAPITNAQDVAGARSGQSASLRGEIVSQQARSQYVLTDGTGNVLVEIGDELLKGNRLAPGTEVEVEGTVDVRLMHDAKVDVRVVTILALHDAPPAAAAEFEPQG